MRAAWSCPAGLAATDEELAGSQRVFPGSGSDSGELLRLRAVTCKKGGP